MLTRRRFIACSISLVIPVAAGFPKPALAQAKPKIVIIGGGAGGGTVLRRLSGMAKDRLDITLIEPQTTITTCYYSNLYLGGVHRLESLQFNLSSMAAAPGIRLVRDAASAIDLQKSEVRLAHGGAGLTYDRLVVSPGIDVDYGSVPGWSWEAQTRMPHAWAAGAQTVLLKSQLDAVPDGGLIVMIAPPNPYRCPPGPYERVSMMAQALKAAGKGRARIVILDPKEKFSKQALFLKGWEKHYPGMIEWIPASAYGGIKTVNPEAVSVETDFDIYKAALVNVIPRQTAGRIALQSGLAGENGFCPIDPFTMKSRADAKVFVLGDASIAGDMPKSAFSANSQASAVASVIGHELLGLDKPEISYRNKCWSLIAEDDSIFVGGKYRPTEAKIAEVENEISNVNDTADTRRVNYDDSAGWYANLTNELYV